MKLTMYHKDSVRKLRKSIFRYISIILIIMLGVGFFVGMNSVSPDMKNTTEQYLKDTNVFDIQLLSNLGYEEEDIKKFEEIQDVEIAEPIYSYDVLTKSGNKNIPIRVISKKENSQINKNSLVEGREPQTQAECLIDTKLKNMYGYNVGDTISISKKGEDIKEKFTCTEYKIVGITRNPAYLSIFYGSTELENGELTGYIIVNDGVMKLDEYSAIYIKTNIDNNIEKTSKEYKERLNPIAEIVEKVNIDIVNSKYDKKYNEIKQEIEDKEQDVKDAIKKVKETKEQINNSQKSINDAIIQVNMATVSNQEINNQKQKLDKLYIKIEQLKTEKEEIEEKYDILKEQIEDKELELFNLNNSINNKYYESSILKNENSKAVELIREANKLDYEYNAKKEEVDKLKEEFSELENSINSKDKKINKREKELKEKQESFYNCFIENIDKNFSTGNQVLGDTIERIKQNQKELDSSIQEFEEQNSDKKIEEAKEKIMSAKSKLIEFEPVSQTIKLTQSGAFKSLDNDLEKIGIMGKVFPVMFFVVAALVTITTITRMVEEDRTNIGTLKSLGYKKSKILSKYIIYSLSATLLGLIFGTIIGSTLIAQVLFAAYSSLYILPDLIIEINIFYTVLASIISIFATVGVTYIITSKELKEKPAMLMRPKQDKEGKNIILEKFPLLWGRLNFLYKICFRNIFRYKRRLFMTLIGIAGCTMLVYTGISLKSTIDNIATRQFAEVRIYDVEINLGIAENQKSADELEIFINEQPNVKECTPSRQQMTTIEANNVNKDIFYTVIDKKDVSKFIHLKERETQKDIELTDDGIVLTEKLARVLNVKEGDIVKLIEKDKEKNVKVTGISENYVYNYMYITPELYTQIYDTEVQYNLFLANTEDLNEDEEIELSNRLKENDKISGAVYVRSLDNDYHKSLSGLSSIVFLFIGCASLLSFIVLINLNNINIEERRRELATFKVLGFYKKELEHYIFRENILLTILGAVLGVFLGISVLGIIIESAEVETIMIPVELSIIDSLISTLITLGFTLITNFIMKKKIKKVNMVESLKSVE